MITALLRNFLLYYCCFNSYSTFFTADNITANAIAISNLDADATAKNNYFLIDQSSGTLKKELVFL